MTLTSSSSEWLSQNRARSYPMDRDEWREKVHPGSGVDCVLLDALAFNSDSSGGESLVFESLAVSPESTNIVMSYGGKQFSVVLTGGETSGDGSFERVRMSAQGTGSRKVTLSLAFSSHAYILEAVGVGRWELGCRVMESRVVGLTDGMGVDGVNTNGSSGVDGHESAASASGDVVLEDGYRTSPVVHNGGVVVRVGKRYGIDPCKYNFGPGSMTDCRVPLFFFCGQNGINSGNIVLKGGAGVSVTQGRSYRVRSGTCKDKTIPCIEIVAGSELLGLYSPQTGS